MGQTTPTPPVKQTSKLFSLNWQDALHGLIMAVGSAVLTAVYNSIQSGSITINWPTIGSVASIATVTYLLKKFFSPTQAILKTIIVVVISFTAMLPSKASAQTIVTTDSVYNTWYAGLNVSPVGFTLDGAYHIGAAVSVGYKKVDYNYASKTSVVKHSFNFVYVPLVTGQPITSVKNFLMLGATYGFDNDLIQVGPFYYPPGTSFKNQIGIMFISGINL